MTTVTMDPSCIGPLLQHSELVECWLTDEGETVWLWRNDLALVLTLDMAARCPTCGRHEDRNDRWSITRADVLANRLFRRGYS